MLIMNEKLTPSRYAAVARLDWESAHEHLRHTRRRSPGDESTAAGPLEPLGAVPRGACLGHGAGRLQRQRRRLELLLPRSRALAGLPLERGWPGRHLRPAPVPVFRPGALERPRAHPQGAAVWPAQW